MHVSDDTKMMEVTLEEARALHILGIPVFLPPIPSLYDHFYSPKHFSYIEECVSDGEKVYIAAEAAD